MSTFSARDFNAMRYSSSRPTYPREFYELLQKYHDNTEPHQRILDIGCGPGTATFQMAKYLNLHKTSPIFTDIVGTDLSGVMIKQAKANLAEHSDEFPHINMEFEVVSYDEINPREKYDLITAVECVHWFDFGVFQRRVVDRLLKPHGGTVAIWGYADPILVDYPDLDALYDAFTYCDDKLGPYWQQPGRSILRSMLREFKFDTTLFKDIHEVYFDAKTIRDNAKVHSTDMHPEPLLIVKNCTLHDYIMYTRTFSAYHSWKGDAQNEEKPDICDQFLRDIMKAHPELTPESPVRLCWSTFIKFGKSL